MRAPSPAPGACGIPHGRTRLPRAPGKPASQYPIRSCEPAPRTPPQVVGRHHLGTQMPSGGVHPITAAWVATHGNGLDRTAASTISLLLLRNLDLAGRARMSMWRREAGPDTEYG